MFECARRIYNACLGEAKKRLNLIRQSKSYQYTVKLNRTTHKQERTQRFDQLNQVHGFSEYALHGYAKQFGKCWIGEHVGSHIGQKMASRAFNAVQRVAFGKAKCVKFKPKDSLVSIEGKNNVSDITFDGTSMTVHVGFKKKGLNLPVMLKPKDEYAHEALNRDVAYCRIVRKTIRGRQRYYLQLILKGTPPKKIKKEDVVDETVGLDIGPSTIAIASNTGTHFDNFCPELDELVQEQRRLQRSMDRKQRASNPDNYNSDGTIKKRNRKPWVRSNNYQRTRMQYLELKRKVAAKRQQAHNQLITVLITQYGTHVRTENVCYKAFQRRFGKSVGRRAPGMFIERLKWKLTIYGGSLLEFSTYSTKCSQYCHVCGTYTKKPLSQRVHTCCNLNINRDLYSAFLARNVKDDKIHQEMCDENWPRFLELAN